jgi:hypothetical protein
VTRFARCHNQLKPAPRAHLEKSTCTLPFHISTYPASYLSTSCQRELTNSFLRRLKPALYASVLLLKCSFRPRLATCSKAVSIERYSHRDCAEARKERAEPTAAMSVDPYHAVQSEIQTSLQAAISLRASFIRIRKIASNERSEELVGVRDEVRLLMLACGCGFELLRARGEGNCPWGTLVSCYFTCTDMPACLCL